jgi:flagellar basal body-associated protein FliL
MEENNNSSQQNNLPDNNNKDEEEKKKNRKKMWIIIGIAIGAVIILIIVLLLLLTLCRNRDMTGNETAEITQAVETTQVTAVATESTKAPETTASTSSATTETTAEETTSSEEDTTETEETTAEEVAEPPTISLAIVEGPTFSPSDEVCFFRVQATVTGIPEPDVDWNIDDALGAYIAINKVQVNINNPAQTRTLEATATNSEGSVTKSITLSWGCNRPPEIQEITLMGDHYINTEYTVSASASDPDGDTLTYQWSVTGGPVYDEDVNPMEWTTPAAPGFYNITVTVDDGNGGTDSLTESVEVKETNDPPIAGSITITEKKTGYIPTYIYVNYDYEVSVEAWDPDRDKLNYDWTATGGSITKRGQNPAEWQAPSSPGFYTITVTVSDGKGGTDSEGIYVQVRDIVY